VRVKLENKDSKKIKKNKREYLSMSPECGQKRTGQSNRRRGWRKVSFRGGPITES